jgi:hypothetical protein
MHIPKSAGTSVRVALEKALLSETISPKRQDSSVWCGFDEFNLLDPRARAQLAIREDEIAALADYRVVSGHFSLPTLLRLTSASAVATVLREPRARVLSHYEFCRLQSPIARRIWRGYPAYDHALRPLDEFLVEPEVAGVTDNLVCRMLLGDDPRIPKAGFIADSDIDTVALDAIGELATLGYVGVLELGDSIWERLSGFFGAPLAPSYVNATESLSENADAPAAGSMVTLDTLDVLDARTGADALVYRHVLSTGGYSARYVERLQATAFATELVRLGNLVGTSATEARIRGRRSEELAREVLVQDEELRRAREQLFVKDEELERADTVVQETRQQLAETNEQLRWHRLWLERIQGSASWRLTAPLRAGKRTFRRVPSSATGAARRAEREP